MKAEFREAARFLGQRLRRAREDLGLSQEKLAELLGSNQERISDYERGKTLPKMELLLKLTHVLRCPAGFFFPRGSRWPRRWARPQWRNPPF